MNNRNDKPKTHWREYIQYGLVTLGLLAVGVLLAVGLAMSAMVPNTHGKRKWWRWALALVPVLMLVLAGYALFLYYSPVDLGTRVVPVLIREGDSLQSVLDTLYREGIIRSKAVVRYPAIWRSIDKKLAPGRYDFSGKISARDVLNKFDAAEFARVKVTVFEGASIWKVAGILKRQLEIDSAEVVRLNTDSALLRQLELPHLEGYLYPETYIIPWGTSAEQVVKEMVAMYRSQTDSIWPETMPNGLTREQVMVLASIVQAESRLDAEKPKVASVYHNRIARKMKLDADPTVIYGLGGLTRPLSRRDLTTPTPYNTYLQRGLPPTPINSPGLPAIKAALNPDTSEYLFFVADGTGGHRFSRTNDEHNRARYEIRRSLKRNGQ